MRSFTSWCETSISELATASVAPAKMPVDPLKFLSNVIALFSPRTFSFRSACPNPPEYQSATRADRAPNMGPKLYPAVALNSVVVTLSSLVAMPISPADVTRVPTGKAVPSKLPTPTLSRAKAPVPKFRSPIPTPSFGRPNAGISLRASRNVSEFPSSVRIRSC